MAKRKITNPVEVEADAPETLAEHPFYGFKLDEYQTKFRDAIWNPDKLIIFCNAKAGSGKTLISFATANLLVRYGKYNGIIYVVNPYGEDKQGFLPGTITEKSEVYFEPLYQAMISCDVMPQSAIIEDSMVNEKQGTGYVKCLTHTYLRGANFENKVVIIDEAQNFDFFSLKKTITRIHDSCKVIVIGHEMQKDTSDTTNAFSRYRNYYKQLQDSRVEVCDLRMNYRGWISQSADDCNIESFTNLYEFEKDRAYINPTTRLI